MIRSYAQNHEDVLLARAFRDVERGFYVDVGANDPTQGSVTRYFYDAGWRGINVEPGSIFTRLAEERPGDVNLNLAVSDVEGELTFHEFPDVPGLSTVASSSPGARDPRIRGAVARTVQSRTLCSILDEHAPGTIDFLSIDVEGHEQQVIASNDWNRHRPRVLVIEATLPNTNVPCHHGWEPLVRGAHYLFAFFDGINRYYVREEEAGLLQHFQCPVNALDDYVEAGHEMQVRLLNEQINRLTEAHDRLAQSHAAAVQALRELTHDTGARGLRVGLGLARMIHRLGKRLRRAS